MPRRIISSRQTDNSQKPGELAPADASKRVLCVFVVIFVSNLVRVVAAQTDPGVAAFESKLAAGRASWAFAAPREPVVPQVRNAEWCKSPIDHFILEQLEAKNLKPAAPAPRRALIRRAYFDLIGLPPGPEEVEAFLHDDSPDAFAKVVDRLLARPQYGERWARHWLDVVRYTDSFDARGVGSAGDVKYAWRYRDWVIKALNQDLPYDQFVMNQVAGDVLPGRGTDGIVATGMYVLGNWPGGDADREKMMTDIVDDQIDVTGRAFLGITLACARCHDHKFDPISQKDYYGLAGIFFSSHFLPSPGSKTSGSPLVVTSIATPDQIKQQRQRDERIAALQKKIDQFADEQYASLGRSMLPQAGEYVSAAIELDRSASQSPAPSTDQFATDKKLDRRLLRQWVDYLRPMLHQGSELKLLTRASHNVAGNAGVDEWSGADGRPDPCVLVNDTDHPVSFSTLTLPAYALSMHPGPKTGVAVVWTSPIEGRIRIQGRVIDGDPNCGDGIDWRLEQTRDHSRQTLAEGAFPNSGSQAFSQGQAGGTLEAVDVRRGDQVQLTVFPKETYFCDTTIVEFEISELDGGKRSWGLRRDVVPDLLAGEKGNPHADSYGNPSVWRFGEAGEESRTNALTPGSSLAAWIGSASGEPKEASDDRASKLTAVLLALDHQAAEAAQAGESPAAPGGADAGLYRDLTDPRGPFWASARKDNAALSPRAQNELSSLSKELADLKSVPPVIEEADALLEGGVPQSQYEGIHDSAIMIRGRYDRKGPVVPRAFPRLLAGDDQPPIRSGSGRLELARWIASPDNPMTAKVLVNRLWQHHFGQGIVRTPNNFGKLGVPPTHPRLLDYLARRFIDSGWSIKAMQRTIMLSAAYQQSSVPDEQTDKADPDNKLFGRMNRRRLEAEPFRDALLDVSGSLDPTMGGPAYRDPMTGRRTIYLMTIRSDRSNYRTLFDAADPTSIVDQRIDSTVAPQALFLMNDPFVLNCAKSLASQAMKQKSNDRRRIDELYRLLYSRPATEKEIEIGLSAVGQDQASWESYCQVLLCANEFVYVD